MSSGAAYLYKPIHTIVHAQIYMRIPMDAGHATRDTGDPMGR
jgi:hypothetical protein